MNIVNDSRKSISIGWVITKVAIGAVSGAILCSLIFLNVSSSFSDKLIIVSIGVVPGAVLYPIGAILYRLWGRKVFLIGVILAIFLVISAGWMILIGTMYP